jgi:flagellar basal-body rod protein FlgB
MAVDYLFKVVSSQNHWLSVRQSLIAGNIANANTPGFKAQDVEPFEKVLNSTSLVLAKTTGGHLDLGASDVEATNTKDEDSWEITHSGNSVSVEQELIKANDVNRSYRLNTSIIKAFHGMLMSAAKV